MLITPSRSTVSAWRPRINVNSRVLLLTVLTVYSVKQVREAIQKVLKQDEPEFRSEE